MRTKDIFSRRASVVTVLALTILVPSAHAGSKILYSFRNDGSDGAIPLAGLVFDSANHLYGTTAFGGVHGEGTVFELVPQSDGSWTERILHSFDPGVHDGAVPAASLILDTAGNLYGTTTKGGAYGYGTVFEMAAQPGGRWTERILHSFDNVGAGGGIPSGLLFDALGNLYGTAFAGGSGSNCRTGAGCGTVFELSLMPDGSWTEKILHSFVNNGTDGFAPESNLIFDAAGNLYGTTYQGGEGKYGTVFRLTATRAGEWTETTLYSFNFNGVDGINPSSGLTFDSSGNLYGTTYQGGAYGQGIAFELSPAGGTTWAETILHTFGLDGIDGNFPLSGLIFDASGNLYGSTGYGGTSLFGTVFELSPGTSSWAEEILANFDSSNGYEGPHGDLIIDHSGNLFGTSASGGAGNAGIVFEVTP